MRSHSYFLEAELRGRAPGCRLEASEQQTCEGMGVSLQAEPRGRPRGCRRQGLGAAKLHGVSGLSFQAGSRGRPRGWRLDGLGAAKLRDLMGLSLEAGRPGWPRGWRRQGRSKQTLRSTLPFSSRPSLQARLEAPGRGTWKWPGIAPQNPSSHRACSTRQGAVRTRSTCRALCAQKTVSENR